MPNFFEAEARGDNEVYLAIRNEKNKWNRKARRLTNRMWARCGTFVDDSARERARKDDFYAVWSELYIAYALTTSGIELVATKERIGAKGGPDLLTRDPRVWIEVVEPKPGDGPDSLREPLMDGKAYSVPLEEYVLRLRTAIDQKMDMFGKYMINGTIKTEDSTVIAISAARLPFRFQEYPIPRVVRALLAIGSLEVQINVDTMKQVDTTVEYRDHIVKKSNAEVPTDLFLKKQSAHVSAVLYSGCDCWNYPSVPGSEFILVHNPNANVPIPHDWLRSGRQYWIHDQQLRWSDVAMSAS